MRAITAFLYVPKWNMDETDRMSCRYVREITEHVHEHTCKRNKWRDTLNLRHSRRSPSTRISGHTHPLVVYAVLRWKNQWARSDGTKVTSKYLLGTALHAG